MDESKTLPCIMKKLQKTMKVFDHTVRFLSFLDNWIQWTAYTEWLFCSFSIAYFSYTCLNKKPMIYQSGKGIFTWLFPIVPSCLQQWTEGKVHTKPIEKENAMTGVYELMESFNGCVSCHKNALVHFLWPASLWVMKYVIF